MPGVRRWFVSCNKNHSGVMLLIGPERLDAFSLAKSYQFYLGALLARLVFVPVSLLSEE
jgi:hypothetical protein